MAILQCTGPAHVWVGIPANYTTGTVTPVYFGTAEVSPSIETSPVIGEVFNDLAGSRRFDRQYYGDEAVIQVLFTRWNEGVYTYIASRPSVTAASAPGFCNNVSVGSFYQQQGLAYQMWVQFPYSGLAPFSTGVPATSGGISNAMPGGYHFYSVHVERDQQPKMGTQDRQLMIQWLGLPLYVPSNPTNTWQLYDSSMAALSGRSPD